jgi:regulator of nucleoside diphosphate kinase
LPNTQDDYGVAAGDGRRADGYAMPSVHLTEDDYDCLENLARSGVGPGAQLLGREVDRAVVVPADALPAGCARLGSWVEYVDLLHAQVRTVQLVAPGDADIDANRLSVLSPVGAALIGLKAEDTFGWTGENGLPRVLVVHRVTDRP